MTDDVRTRAAPCPFCKTPAEGLPGYAARCPKCLAYFTVPRTTAQNELTQMLESKLFEGSRFRAGLVLFAYEGDDGEPRMSHAMGMRDKSLECAVEVVKMIRRLRDLADELDTFTKNAGPLPAQEEKG